MGTGSGWGQDVDGVKEVYGDRVTLHISLQSVPLALVRPEVLTVLYLPVCAKMKEQGVKVNRRRKRRSRAFNPRFPLGPGWPVPPGGP